MASTTALKRQKSDPQEDPLAHTLVQIRAIVDYLASNKGTVRGLSGPDKANVASTIERALSLIIAQLAAVDTTVSDVRDSFCKALALLSTALPPDLAGFLCKLFQPDAALSWFMLLVPQLARTDSVAVQEVLVAALVTLASFVQHGSLAMLRQSVFRDLLRLMDDTGGALARGAVPFHSDVFKGVDATTPDQLYALHESCVSLGGHLSVSIGPFVSDLLGGVWRGVCCALALGRPQHASLALACALQLSQSSEMPAVCHDDFLRALCRMLHPAFGAREVVADARLAHLLLGAPPLPRATLCAFASTLCPLIVQDASMASSDSLLPRALLSMFHACQVATGKPMLELLAPLLGGLAAVDAHEQLAVCVLEAGQAATAAFVREIAEQQSKLSARSDARTLLGHTRSVCILNRALLKSEIKELGAVPQLLQSLLYTLLRCVRVSDSLWCPHAVTVFRFAAAHAAQLQSVYGGALVDSLYELLLVGWIEPARAMLCDAAFVQAAMAAVELMGASPLPGDAHATQCRTALTMALVQDNSEDLHHAALVALRVWLVRAPPRECIAAAQDILAYALSGGARAARLGDLIGAVGLCACAASACLGSNGVCRMCDAIGGGGAEASAPVAQADADDGSSKRGKIGLGPWRLLLSHVQRRDAASGALLAIVAALPRVVAHLRASDSAVVQAAMPALFELARHEHLQVRLAFAQLVPSLCKYIAMLPDQLVPLLTARLVESAPPVQRTILATMAQIAMCVGKESAWFFPAFYALVGSFHRPDLGVRAVAYQGVRDVARAHGMTEAQLFERHQRDLYTILVNKLVTEPALFEEVAQFLDVKAIDLLKATLPICLPKLVASEAVDVLTEVASRLGRNPLGVLLNENCVPVLQYILIEEPNHDVSARFLCKHTHLSLGELMDSCVHDLLRELVILLGDEEEHVRRKCVAGINTLGRERAKYQAVQRKQTAPTVWGNDELADFISENFLAIIEHLVTTLLPSNDNMTERRSALLGFDQLLQLMARGHKNSHLLSLRPKITATLKLAMRQPDLQEVACEVFRNFLAHLGLEHVGPLLGQIVVDLLPLVTQDVPETTSRYVVTILEWLVVHNEAALARYFQDVHFLPDSPELAHVRDVIEKHNVAHGKGEEAADRMLKRLTMGLQHESVSVRLTAVDKLTAVLRRERHEIDKRLLQRQRVDPLIEDMLPHLLMGSRALVATDSHTQFAVRDRYAACLGLLGAIDPSRVDLRLRAEFPHENADPEQLALDLLMLHLLPALKDAKSPEIQDHAAFAIQEVLKFCGCDSTTPLEEAVTAVGAKPGSSRRNRGIRFWRRLDPHVRAVVKPYLSSFYVLADPRPPERADPFYVQHVTFRKWIGHFAGMLIAHVTGPTKPLFDACRSGVKDHEQTARYLLPYLVLRVAVQNDVANMVEQELCAVLRAEGAKTADMAQLCSQTVFHLIDVLSHWIVEKRKLLSMVPVAPVVAPPSKKPGTPKRPKTSHAAGGAGDGDLAQVELPPEYLAVDGLLRRIPQLLIAKAAFRCGAYARALKCVETSIREERQQRGKAGALDLPADTVSFLQKICGGLDDEDGLEGLTTLRRPQTPREQILDLEHRGSWAHALDWYDAALRSEGDGLELKLGQLRCMLHLGHFETMLALVRSARDDPNTPLRFVRRNQRMRTQASDAAPVIGVVNVVSASQQGRPDGAARELPRLSPPQRVAGSNGVGAAVATERSLVAGGFDSPASPLAGAGESAEFLSFGMQAAWRLGNWHEVLSFNDCNLPVDDFEANVGRALLCLVRSEHNLFHEHIQKARVEVMGPLMAASMDSYPRTFPYLLQLHMIAELEDAGLCVLRQGDGGGGGSAGEHARIVGHSGTREQWNNRLRMAPPAFKVRQQLLHLRRVVAQLHSGSSARHWVEVAKAARVDGQLEAARGALVQALAVDGNDVSALIERAQLLWTQGKRQQGIQEVEQVIRMLPKPDSVVRNDSGDDGDDSDDSGDRKFEERRKMAKPELLLGRWLHETGQKTFQGIRAQFDRVTQICPEWESGHFHLARYLDEVMKSIELEYSPDTTAGRAALRDALKFLPEILKSYRKGLQSGHKHIHQALPRMLTLYFRYARELATGTSPLLTGRDKEELLRKTAESLSDEMKLAVKDMPVYMWLSALPQIISRVCHDSPDVKVVLSTLIQKLFRQYPHQCMWLGMGVIRSRHREHAKKELCDIFSKAMGASQELKRVHDNTKDFAALISMLCKHNFGDAGPNRVKLSTVASLGKLLKFQAADVVLIPTELALAGTLPLRAHGRVNANGWNPFDELKPARLKSVVDEVEVIRSLQTPKVCTLVGHDGKHYRFLAKPKDDLRKDSRVMEVNSLVNKLLDRDVDSRRRQLRITTYGVVPMDEETGLIEWVPNLLGYRNAVLQSYATRANKDMKAQYEALATQPPAARYEEVMKQFPPRFYQWFALRFPEAASWQEARAIYTRSAAVMSMVGAVIGLGDRHGENILLNTKTGHVVHVDFNAVFHKGETFTVPERVPFRLTRNMVDAMGLAGYEGAYRRVCEITMTVLRRHREMVVSVLETFLHDPLLEFCSKSASAAAKRAPAQEPVNEFARDIISKVERALLGKIDASTDGAARAATRFESNVARAVSLSVEGHVEHLIQQAVNPAHLGAMFVGWAPWL